MQNGCLLEICEDVSAIKNKKARKANSRDTWSGSSRNLMILPHHAMSRDLIGTEDLYDAEWVSLDISCESRRILNSSSEIIKWAFPAHQISRQDVLVHLHCIWFSIHAWLRITLCANQIVLPVRRLLLISILGVINYQGIDYCTFRIVASFGVSEMMNLNICCYAAPWSDQAE